jgi:tripartite ATP-independent transporter DctP family solute receptor
MKAGLRFTFLILLAVQLVGCGDGNNARVLKLGHSLPKSHPVHKALEQMALQVKQDSEGSLTIDIYPNEQLGSEREMIEQLQLGSLHIVKTSASPLEGFIPEMALFTVPYVFEDHAHLWETLDGEIGQDLLKAGKEKGVVGLCYYDAGSRSFYTKEKPVKTPADLKGLKIRVQNSKTAMQMVEAMGGAPTPIAFGELYTSLEQGVVDGAENNPPSLLTSRHYEICKYYALDEHSAVPDVVLIGETTWSGLTPSQQAMIQKAANDSAIFQRELWAKENQRALEELAAAGVEISHPDKAPFQDSVKTLHESYEGTAVGDLLKQIQQSRTTVSN